MCFGNSLFKFFVIFRNTRYRYPYPVPVSISSLFFLVLRSTRYWRVLNLVKCTNFGDKRKFVVVFAVCCDL